ncbi:UNVERIFIED_CONTAM: Retrovirus-related Pol polyprotein from transposon TNT 1-94 [Sesamum angustifolium]|uniref:Retrovirus-related Pol polyprotein from transposon TNT 1-94 n=1 Tax=Sesamum angustifolium TaxID=2727405 RepID=A0AAW2IXP9_9LAMI
MASLEAKQWKETFKSEMDFIVSNGTRVLVDLPPGCTTIGSRLTTIWVLIALTWVYNLPIHQMDVKTTFFYGELEEEIYMDQPEGFVVHCNKRKDPKTAEIAQWTERDQIGRGAILSVLSNTFFNVYCSDSYAAKSQWDELDRKYNTEEQGLKKYYVSKLMRYHMVEDRSIAEQTHEIINLEHALADAEMKLPEKFLVMSIVDKFPKSWENFGMTLKHQKGRLSLDDLMIAISIEEEHRNQTHKMPLSINLGPI